MEVPGRTRALADVATAMAGFLAAGMWLMAVSTGMSGLVPFAGLTAGTMVVGSAAISIVRRTHPRTTPADRVTLARVVLVACCAALAVSALLSGGTPGVPFLVAGTLAFLLDAVDGAVARRFGCASPAGEQFDIQTDAALVLVLSCAAAGSLGPWVLAVGLWWYAFRVAGWFRPALRGRLGVSRLRKAIGACQPLAFLLALVPGIPARIGAAVVAMALVTLTASFMRDIMELERSHDRHGGARGYGSWHQRSVRANKG